MARRLEQTTLYPAIGMQDEWQPYTEVDTHGWSDAEFKQFVRLFNRRAKQEGDNTRVRSVEDEEGFW